MSEEGNGNHQQTTNNADNNNDNDDTTDDGIDTISVVTIKSEALLCAKFLYVTCDIMKSMIMMKFMIRLLPHFVMKVIPGIISLLLTINNINNI